MFGLSGLSQRGVVLFVLSGFISQKGVVLFVLSGLSQRGVVLFVLSGFISQKGVVLSVLSGFISQKVVEQSLSCKGYLPAIAVFSAPAAGRISRRNSVSTAN